MTEWMRVSGGEYWPRDLAKHTGWRIVKQHKGRWALEHARNGEWCIRSLTKSLGEAVESFETHLKEIDNGPIVT